MKKMWIIFSCSFALLLALTVSQMFLGLIPKDLYPAVLLGSAILFSALPIIFAAVNKKFCVSYSPVKNIFCTILGLFASIAIIFRSIYDIYNFAVLKEFLTQTFVDRYPVFYLVSSILGIISATIFLIMSIANGFGLNPLAKLPGLTLLLPVWYCLVLVMDFVTSISRRNSVENSIEVLSMVFILLFLFFNAKLLSGVEEKSSIKFCFVYGLPAVITVFASSLIYFIAMFTKKEFDSTLSIRLHAVNLLIGLYILSFLISLSLQKKAALEESEEDIQPEEEIQLPEPNAEPALESAPKSPAPEILKQNTESFDAEIKTEPEAQPSAEKVIPPVEKQEEALPLPEKEEIKPAPVSVPAVSEPIDPIPVKTEIQEKPASNFETAPKKEKISIDDLLMQINEVKKQRDTSFEKPASAQRSRSEELMRKIDDVYRSAKNKN